MIPIHDFLCLLFISFSIRGLTPSYAILIWNLFLPEIQKSRLIVLHLFVNIEQKRICV